MDLLKKICKIHAPSGDEVLIKDFILNYVKKYQNEWNSHPKIYHGGKFQDNIILVFGNPRTAVFAHIDSIGFTVKYNNEIIKIGGPVTNDGILLTGKDSKGKIEGKIVRKKDNKLYIDFHREIDRGTSLVFKMNFRETKDYIQSCYLDNRLGVWNALELSKSLKDGIVVFSTWEEHGGGSVGYLGKFIQNNYNVMQALISDITWVTEGVSHGNGCVISIRDSGIPRKSYVNKIIDIAEKNNIIYQLEVEEIGGSDGNSLQKSDYPWDWCFVGAPENNVHSPDEKVYKSDIKSMISLYKILMEKL
tara:strand:- start:913 stop:1824 length:912 start_codon:yes stop_codon:yes gene_type:complete